MRTIHFVTHRTATGYAVYRGPLREDRGRYIVVNECSRIAGGGVLHSSNSYRIGRLAANPHYYNQIYCDLDEEADALALYLRLAKSGKQPCGAFRQSALKRLITEAEQRLRYIGEPLHPFDTALALSPEQFARSLERKAEK